MHGVENLLEPRIKDHQAFFILLKKYYNIMPTIQMYFHKSSAELFYNITWNILNTIVFSILKRRCLAEYKFSPSEFLFKLRKTILILFQSVNTGSSYLFNKLATVILRHPDHVAAYISFNISYIMLLYWSLLWMYYFYCSADLPATGNMWPLLLMLIVAVADG